MSRSPYLPEFTEISESPDVFYSGADLETLAAAPRYQNWIFDQIQPHLGGIVAEFGAGLGTFSNLILPHCEALHLIEPSPPLFKRLEMRFSADQRVSVSPDTIERYLTAPGRPRFDAVVMINVLEHIQDDAACLAQLHGAIHPGGKLLLFVPAMEFLFSKLDREVGHFRRYTKPALHRRLADAGFIIERIGYMDLLGIAPWYLVNTLGGATGFNPFLVRLYDMVGIPLTRLAERLVPAPVGKNLIAVAAKSS